MISDLVVWTSVALAVAFVVAWVVSPRLRAWIERPSHAFLDAVRRYDRDTKGEREQTRP